jgi:hypothetical protein
MKTKATSEQLQAARDRYQCCDINIDDDAEVSEAAGEGYWVQAWVWVGGDEE